MSKNNDAIICFILFSIIIIAPPTRDLNIWLCGRQTDLSVMRVKVGMANFFFESIDRYWRNKYISVKIVYLACELWAPQVLLACGP